MRRREAGTDDGKAPAPAPRRARRAAKGVAAACMAALFEIAMDPEESGSTRVAAITRLLEREIGRPVPPNMNPGKDEVGELSDEELLRIAARGGGGAAAAAEEPA